MRHNQVGNLLMVSNYPSDTAYAWWLMEHFWITLANLFSQCGGTVYLAYPRITSLSEGITTAPIESIEMSLPWRSGKQAAHALGFLRKKNISSIYLTDQKYFNQAYAMMRLCGVRRIVIHDHTPGDRPPVHGLKGTLKSIRNKTPWVTADHVLCVSELMRRRNLENARIPDNRCTVVQNGIQPVTCDRNKAVLLRAQLGIRDESIVVCTTGRAHPYKRFDFIIECANELRRRAPGLDVVFLLIGSGPDMPSLREQVQRLGLGERVQLLGFRKDVRNLLCASDIALHAALGEGFSLSIIEYMSAGLPVLLPDIPSVSQAISHNETGIVYPRDDTEAVAADIHKLAIDTVRRVTMGKAAKSRADSDYDLDRCTNDFITAIKSVYHLET